MCYNVSKKYLIISLLFISSSVKTMELVNVPNDILVRIALPLVNNNDIPFAFHHSYLKTNVARHTNETLDLLYRNESYATFSYVSLALTCKKIYEVLNIKSCMPQKVDLCILVQWLGNFRNITAKQRGWNLIHYNNIKEVKESFSLEIYCWTKKADAQWVIKCFGTNQAKNKYSVVSSINGKNPLLQPTPLWNIVCRLIQYSIETTLKVNHAQKIGDGTCTFSVSGVFKDMRGDFELCLPALYYLIKKIARAGRFDWIDDTHKELVTSFFGKYVIVDNSTNS